MGHTVLLLDKQLQIVFGGILAQKTWFSPFSGDLPQAIAFSTAVDLLGSGLSDSISCILDADIASAVGDTEDLSVVGLLGITLLIYFAAIQAGSRSSNLHNAIGVAGEVALKICQHLSTKGAYLNGL